jgi:dienelactone hydrolase
MLTAPILAIVVAVATTHGHHLHPAVKPHPVAVRHAEPAPRQAPEPAVTDRDPALGTWQGSATFQGARLALSVRFFRTGTSLAGELSCADFLLLDNPLDHVRRTARGVAFDTRDDSPLHVEATVEGDTLRGTGVVPSVPGMTGPAPLEPMSIVLARVPDAPPPPYATRDVVITSAGTRLAGTVFAPPGARTPLPGVVLLQGSSTNLRREYGFYADLFARAGFAVLAFDKRGSGSSGGDYGAATYEQLADDAAAAVQVLRRTEGVDSTRVGIWGLSQGSFLAPFVARRVPLSFIVAVSAPGLPIGETATYQDSMRLAAAGFDGADVRRVTTLDRRLYEWLQGGGSTGEMSALLAEAASSTWRRASSLPAMLPAGRALESWYWRGRTLDPGSAWRDVDVPVLAIYGAADELMPAKANQKALERALRAGHDRDVTVKTFPAANHVIRRLPLVAGGRWDWPRVMPGYLDLVTAWMERHSQAVVAGH